MNPSSHPVSKLRVAATQMRFATRIEENIEKIAQAVSQAKKRRADVVLFPECATTGYNTYFASLKPGKIRARQFSASTISIEALENYRHRC